MASKDVRVLIADDHQALLDRVVTLLTRDFNVVGAVHDGHELVAAEAALLPDVLVVDISMPTMTGLEAAARIRRRGSHAVVVYLTAHDEQEIIDAALAQGAFGYVNKTCLACDLVPAIHAALARRQFVSHPDAHTPTTA